MKQNQHLLLRLDDASCTEAWLQLTTKDLTLPAELTLKQYNPTGDSVTQTFSLSTQDSLLYIDSLLPNQTYLYQVSSITVSSIQYQATSYNNGYNQPQLYFSKLDVWNNWQQSLYDVAIINENNIWAVGEIMIADTSQNGYTTYNAVHWDGSEWELKQIPLYLYLAQYMFIQHRSIFAFNENDIWITPVSQI